MGPNRMNGQHVAYIALGSNLGDRPGNLRRAIEHLAALEGCTVAAQSPLGSYPAEDCPPGAAEYLNGVVELRTQLGPFALLERLEAIETAMGRPGEADRARNADRVIDLDLLLYDQAVIAACQLIVPHPRMHRRRFVLEPLAAIAPEVRHPVLGRSSGELLARLQTGTKGR